MEEFSNKKHQFQWKQSTSLSKIYLNSYDEQMKQKEVGLFSKFKMTDQMIVNIILINRMIKKNPSQRRFNTAAARIMMSGKLPSDFFLPSRQKEGRQSSLYSQKHQDVEGHPHNELNKKDPLLFTFHRSRSEERLKIRKVVWPSESPAPKLFANSQNRKSKTKLPPVSMVVAKENINSNWFKDFGGNKQKLKKLGRISNRLVLNEQTKQQKVIS